MCDRKKYNRDAMSVLSTSTISCDAYSVHESFCGKIISANIHDICIKTHGSESRGQEEAGLRDEPVSYLQVAPL